MNAQERALARDLVARARLAADPAYQIKQRRTQRGQETVRVDRSQPTERELMALRCLSRGMTAPMAAEAMGITLETVKALLDQVRRRLRTKNTTHAVAEAIRRGLIP